MPFIRESVDRLSAYDLTQYHARMEGQIARGPLRGLSMQEYRFAVFANRIIEVRLRASEHFAFDMLGLIS